MNFKRTWEEMKEGNAQELNVENEQDKEFMNKTLMYGGIAQVGVGATVLVVGGGLLKAVGAALLAGMVVGAGIGVAYSIEKGREVLYGKDGKTIDVEPSNA
jgi:hypothetical protein